VDIVPIIVRLVSNNDKLRRLCEEIREAAPGCQWQLVTGDSGGVSAADTDLYIWDYDPKVGVQPSLREDPVRHLFLVHRKDLTAFQTCIARSDVAVLLKPVTRSTLTAFLGLAVSAHAERTSSTTAIGAERDEILQCLMQANLKVQEFDQDRTNFLARALHDFRSPLTAIGGYCDLLLAGVLGPLQDEQKDVIRRMNRSTQRLAQKASAMYELGVEGQVHSMVNCREADIGDCIDQALQEAQSFASTKGILITTNVEPTSGPLLFDPDAIEQVLVHLLENACKFTAKGGTVELAAYPFFWERRRAIHSAPLTGDRRQRHSDQPNAFRIDILNPGLRIPERHLHTMFNGHTSYAGGQDRSGGGLGLAICKMNIVRHDGLIWAENRDCGPAFSFVLPLLSKAPVWSTCRNSESN
jgi:signal transduction histidine kinase